MVIWYLFFPFWCVIPWKIWQPCFMPHIFFLWHQIWSDVTDWNASICVLEQKFWFYNTKFGRTTQIERLLLRHKFSRTKQHFWSYDTKFVFCVNTPLSNPTVAAALQNRIFKMMGETSWRLGRGLLSHSPIFARWQIGSNIHRMQIHFWTCLKSNKMCHLSYGKAYQEP
jgi:hypothetical protein